MIQIIGLVPYIGKSPDICVINMNEAGSKVFLLRPLCFCFIGKILVRKMAFRLI